MSHNDAHTGQCTCHSHYLLSPRRLCHTVTTLTTPGPGGWPMFSVQVAGTGVCGVGGMSDSLMRRKQSLDATPVLSQNHWDDDLSPMRLSLDWEAAYNHYEWHNNFLLWILAEETYTLIISRYKAITGRPELTWSALHLKYFKVCK